MISELGRRHGCCGWQAGSSERFPLRKDAFHVAQEEVGQSHVYASSGPNLIDGARKNGARADELGVLSFGVLLAAARLS